MYFCYVYIVISHIKSVFWGLSVKLMYVYVNIEYTRYVIFYQTGKTNSFQYILYSVMKIKTLLLLVIHILNTVMTQCLLQLCLSVLYIYRSGEALYGVLIYKRKSRVYNQYTRKDCPMGITEQIVQYYKLYSSKLFLKRIEVYTNSM